MSRPQTSTTAPIIPQPNGVFGINSFIDQFAFFSLPKEPVSDVVEWAQARDAEVLIYRY